ncbi:MAG: nitroreductase family protein [Rhodothermaceae bacterium]
MELRTAIEKRASIRNFTSEKVELPVLKELVDMAHLAPSINNSQTTEYVIITKEDLLKEMGQIVHKKVEEMFGASDDPTNVVSKVEKFSTFFEDAPALIVVKNKPYTAIIDNLADSNYSHNDIDSIRNHPNIQSVGAAIQNILLGAVEKNLGACWLTAPLLAKNELEEKLKVEKPYSIAAMIAIGHPKNDVPQREKKTIDEILTVIE